MVRATAAYGLIHEENGYFGISFPEFPGCISGGSDVAEAYFRGMEALNFHVRGLVEDGEQLPKLRPFSGLEADPDVAPSLDGATVVLVPFDVPGKSVRINISVDENLLSSIDQAADATGESRSGWLANAARKRLATA